MEKTDPALNMSSAHSCVIFFPFPSVSLMRNDASIAHKANALTLDWLGPPSPGG